LVLAAAVAEIYQPSFAAPETGQTLSPIEVAAVKALEKKQ
jgi:hypothetical protein